LILPAQVAFLAQADVRWTLLYTLAAVIALVALMIRLYTVTRRRSLAALAESFGGRYEPHDHLDVPRRYRRLVLMQQGHDRHAAHVISGDLDEHPVTCFEYRYEIGFGGKCRVVAWAVIVMELRDARLPRRCTVNRHHPVREAPWIGLPPLPPAQHDALQRFVDDAEKPCGVETHDDLLAIHIPLTRLNADVAWLIKQAATVLQLVLADDQTAAAGAATIAPTREADTTH
jgi:hypothetical protein